MTQTTDYLLYIEDLVTKIWEDNESHFEFMENMNGGDCDCNLHITMNTIWEMWGDKQC